MRDEFKILIGERTAEMVKIAIGSAYKIGETMESTIRGRDLITGLPREVVVTDRDIREAIGTSMQALVQAVRQTLEATPPEIVSDIMHRGLVLVGGGSLIHGIDKLLFSELHIPIHRAEDPLTAVVRGAGIILETLDLYKDILLGDYDDSPPR